MPWLIAATVIFAAPPLPDGRQEVTIQLDAPWHYFFDYDVEAEPEEPKTIPSVQIPYLSLTTKGISE